ncbi:MAG: hypothetical protein K2J20_03030 [Bacilli bacterium]|nr:hypothetical protein [Bacilli bacterium]
MNDNEYMAYQGTIKYLNNIMDTLDPDLQAVAKEVIAILEERVDSYKPIQAKKIPAFNVNDLREEQLIRVATLTIRMMARLNPNMSPSLEPLIAEIRLNRAKNKNQIRGGK